MKFIDLFAGLGGFQVALKELGHECVFACEINKTLAETYKKNFNIEVFDDIKKVTKKDIPKFDILCAGFPCQPFSKAGRQKGLNDKKNGSYFIEDIVRILKYYNPEYFILENVSHLKKHDRERTWNTIKRELDNANYIIKEEILSPHEFGIPQLRKRIFIVGSKHCLDYFSFPTPYNKETDIRDIIDKNSRHLDNLSKKQTSCLNLWQKIINSISSNEELPTFPIWSMEFEATYPFENKNPVNCSQKELSKYKGKHGTSLKNLSKEEQLKLLPNYAKTLIAFPNWKKNYIKKNREFYLKHKKILKKFLPNLKKLSESWQKLEWNCGNSKRNIFDYIIQFRGSGIRIKKTNYSPSLVLSSTQRPIIGWEKRYLSLIEAAKLQSLDSIKLPESKIVAFRALGNAANSKLIKLICSNLIK